MKRLTLVLLCILLVCGCVLTGCGKDDSPAGVVKKELTSAPWYVDMSEGTTAKYTFHKNGVFICDAYVSIEGASTSFTRDGEYAVAEIDGQVVVVLMYIDNGVEVELTVQETESGNAYWIAGCPMYQK